MKIFLTGKPKSGKTTLLMKLLSPVAYKRGLAAKEVRKDGERIGFDLEGSNSNIVELARTDKPTPYPVGRYFVQVEALDDFIEPLFTFKPQQLLYIDEVGQMQLYSSRFKELAATYLKAENHFLGTISSVYESDFIEKIRSNRGILICEVTPDNRTEIEPGLAYAVANRDLIAALTPAAQQAVMEMSAKYLSSGNYISFKKLFKNAVLYVAHNKVRHEESGFLVAGNTNNHHVALSANGIMTCDCDLFNGRGQFEGKSGECSHIQAAQLLLAIEDNIEIS